MPQEHRISARTTLLSVNVQVSVDGRKWTEVEVRDISDGGFGFVSEVEFERGAHLYMEGDVSDFTRQMSISCDIDVIFCGKYSDGRNIYGVKFLNMSKAEHTGLAVFIELMVTKYPKLLVQ